ncbi:creatininase family protein [Listeria welshimeri]|uniref:creatininase family protein n=1 Tax=Listeria welshimeri TaxID=1643 RepID=UPI001887F2B7|nr:creatininase family protein [Listeria welshimeri]MBF2575284.1 creatininase family protein [Listeria welshimeri]
MLYADENSFDIGAKITKTKPVILPIGAVEAHGPHLPLGTDNILASEYSAKIAAETDGFVLPVLPYGQVWSLQDFPGSLTLSNETVTKVVVEIGESLYKKGFRLFVPVSGHLGNMAALKDAARELYAKYPDMIILHIFYPNIQKLAMDVREGKANHHTYIHACEIETSLMLYLSPENADMSRAIDDPPILPIDADFTPTPWQNFTKTAVLGEATLATAEKGEYLIEKTLKTCVELIKLEQEKIRKSTKME